jgi:hypothetical protein
MAASTTPPKAEYNRPAALVSLGNPQAPGANISAQPQLRFNEKLILGEMFGCGVRLVCKTNSVNMVAMSTANPVEMTYRKNGPSPSSTTGLLCSGFRNHRTAREPRSRTAALPQVL